MNIISINDIVEYSPKKLGEYSMIPRIKVNKKEKWIKHVHCNGARFHVLSWYGRYNGHAGVHCSEPDCIYNKPEKE